MLIVKLKLKAIDEFVTYQSQPSVENLKYLESKDTTRSNSLRFGYAFISNSKWQQDSKRTLSFPCPISIQIQLSFRNLEKSIRAAQFSHEYSKPGGSVSRVCTKLARLAPVNTGEFVAIVTKGGRSKKHVWHTPPLTETIDRNSSERTSCSLLPFALFFRSLGDSQSRKKLTYSKRETRPRPPKRSCTS